MTRKDYEAAIVREVESWPGVTVEFKEGSKHPKAAFTYTPPGGGDPVMLARPYASTPSDAFFGVHQMLGDMRRAMKQLGAERDKPAPSKDEDEAPYRKPNDGAAKRQSPVAAEAVEPKPDVGDQLVAAGVASEEQRAVVVAEKRTAASGVPIVYAGDDESGMPADRDAKAMLLAEARARIDAIVDGIYFDLPADIYHEVPRLSASGIKKLCVSPATFWRGSWLDPERPTLEENETDAKILGRAYHMARLEPHLFHDTFVRELDKAEMPKGSLLTGVEMSAKLEDIGLKKSGTNEEKAERLLDHGFPAAKIWFVQQQIWEAERRARTPIPAKYFDQMETDMKRIAGNGDIARLLSGGCAEVSIFWTDRHGIKMKARLDYLHLDHWADLKTFANPNGKRLQKALADALQYNRYDVQAVVYRDAVEAVRVGGLQIIGDATDQQRQLVAQLQVKPHELACQYIFQEKGGVPNLLAREFPFYAVPYSTLFNEPFSKSEEHAERVREMTRHRTRLFVRAEREMIEAKKAFVLHSQVYQPGEPWFPLDATGEFTDDEFHPYWLEGSL